jgi:hypothetical protein
MKKIILMLAIPGLLFVAGANAQNLISNGDFDTADGWFFGGSARYDVDKGTYDWFTTTTPTTNSGLFAYTPDITVIDGQKYLLEGNFSFIDNNASFDTGEVQLYWEVDFAGSGSDIVGTSALAGTISLTSADDSFANLSLSALNFTADDTTINEVKLRVDVIAQAASTSETTSYVLFDNVSLTAVPEPSTYAIIAGFLAFGFVAVRRRMAAKQV